MHKNLQSTCNINDIMLDRVFHKQGPMNRLKIIGSMMENDLTIKNRNISENVNKILAN